MEVWLNQFEEMQLLSLAEPNRIQVVPLLTEYSIEAPSNLLSISQKTEKLIWGLTRAVKSKQGLCSHEFSLLLYELPVSPPITQQLIPVAAPVITGFVGLPQVQSDAVPPAVHPPLFTSNPSV